MKKNTKKTRWIAIGKTHKIVKGELKPAEEKRIPIKEFARSVSIPEEKSDKSNSNEPYGISIDGKLAVSLIADFHNSLPKPVKDYLIDGIGFEFLSKKGVNVEQVRITYSWIVELLKRSAAITIDKNIILKTLSQPLCEGIRFYLCKKSLPGNPNDFLSLVTVGVDANGFDLHYGDESEKPEVKDVEFDDLPTESDTGEYGHPPGGTSIKLDDNYDHHYVLLKYALGKAKNMPAMKIPTK